MGSDVPHARRQIKYLMFQNVGIVRNVHRQEYHQVVGICTALRTLTHGMHLKNEISDYVMVDTDKFGVMKCSD